MGEWISVEDRLPEETGTLQGYLVSTGNWVGIASYIDGEFWHDYVHNVIVEYPVVAWMELPKPYKQI